jgi:glycosyltransferase involved in cell wall biosynthesis
MRYAWSFEEEAGRFPRPVRRVARLGMTAFRRWDRKVAAGVTHFVANSHAVAHRIRACYRRDATVIHPPVDTEFFLPGGTRGDEFLYVGRLTGYKRPELVVEAFRGLPHRLTVVGTGQLEPFLKATAPPNVTLLGEVGSEQLRDLFRSARALVFPVNEDFGITMAEAQACGTPVIALGEGGALDIVSHGETGWLLRTDGLDELRTAIRRAAVEDLDARRISELASRFSAARFRRELRETVARTVAISGERAAA